jgi:hypothetical protein
MSSTSIYYSLLKAEIRSKRFQPGYRALHEENPALIIAPSDLLVRQRELRQVGQGRAYSEVRGQTPEVRRQKAIPKKSEGRIKLTAG